MHQAVEAKEAQILRAELSCKSENIKAENHSLNHKQHYKIIFKTLFKAQSL